MAASAAVVVPLYREPSGKEILSLDRLFAHLGSFDIHFIGPENLARGWPGLREIHFPAGSFESIPAYSRLLLSRPFYQAFQAYDYILIYQPDCLVFSSDLTSWCDLEYDYLGAPWFKDPADPEQGFSRVGNGGLSLRRVASCLQVLEPKAFSLRAALKGFRLPDRDEVPLILRPWK